MNGPHDTFVWFDPDSIEGRFRRLEKELDDLCFPPVADMKQIKIHIAVNDPPYSLSSAAMEEFSERIRKHLEKIYGIPPGFLP